MGYSQTLVLNKAPSHTISTILACFQPVFMQEGFSCSLVGTHILQIQCQKWGDIGTISSFEMSPGRPEPRFGLPQSIAPDELPKYESLLREEVLGLRGRLADLFGQKDVFQNILSEALYEKRVQRQQEFKAWLSSRLQIFGYRNLSFGPVSDGSEKIDDQFDFPIKGTPTQFGVMLRQYALTLRSKENYQRLMCQVLLPGSRKDAGSIPPDANPIEVRLSLGKNLLSIHAHVLPSDGTLLRIRLTGERNRWELWDAIRDELEKLGWFSLPEIPELPTPIEIKPKPQNQETTSISEVWLGIPDVGANRDILRHWHKGLTCGQIAVRVSLTEKTVLNRIHKLRKQYGNVVVPYRKLIPAKKKKTLPP